jgi:putative copper export protein
MPKQLIFGTIKSLHDLFTALWVGGLLTTTITFLPTLKSVTDKSMAFRKLLPSYHRRLRVIALVSMIGLWVTGLLLSRQSTAFAGLFDFSTTYNVLLSSKHLIIIVMVLIALYRGFVLGKKVENFTAKEQKLYVSLLIITTILGVSVLFLSGIGAVFG